MKRKQFIKALGLSTVSLPLLSSCARGDNKRGSSESKVYDGTSSAETSASCVETAYETEGPFPTNDPATLQRLNIKGDRTGIDLDIELTILDGENSCTPLSNVNVDIWHCDKDGNYSEYGGTRMQQANYKDQHFLRGRQVSDNNGKVAYTTIFPGWYMSRATHVHVKISDANNDTLLVTQIAFPEGSNSAVNQVNASNEKGYVKGMNGYTYNSNDNVFGDGVSTEMSKISGNISEGYKLTHSIVV